MRRKIAWIMLTLLLAGGIGGSYVLSESFRNDARKNWETEVAQAARWLSGTTLGWLEESYAPLSGLAILFENSEKVSEDEFWGAADGLAARATAYFLDASAVAHLREETADWRIEFSTDPLGPLSTDLPLDRNPYPEIVNALKVAYANPDQVMLGAPFTTEDGVIYSPVALVVQDPHGPLVIVGLLNYQALTQGVFDVHKLEGLDLQIQGRFLRPDGPGPLQNVLGKPAPDALHTVATRTVSARADLTLSWHAGAQYKGGPQKDLANLTLTGGIAGTLFITLFMGVLLQKNWKITQEVQKVQEATAELTEAKERISLAVDAMNLGVWDWDMQTQQTVWNARMFEIYGIPSGKSMMYQDWGKQVMPEDAPKVDVSLRRTIEKKSQGEVEFRIKRSDGEIRHLYVAQRVILDAEGEVRRVVGVNLDITKRKAADEELHQNMAELERFSKLAVGREDRMIELKKEINAMLRGLSQPEKYKIVV
jgi:two-component system sensor histidine kinase/response regulator